jgi:hypothetical protein
VKQRTAAVLSGVWLAGALCVPAARAARSRDWVPVMEGADALYTDEADYHLTQAEERLNQKDNKAAASAAKDLRQKFVRARKAIRAAL